MTLFFFFVSVAFPQNDFPWMLSGTKFLKYKFFIIFQIILFTHELSIHGFLASSPSYVIDVSQVSRSSASTPCMISV